VVKQNLGTAVLQQGIHRHQLIAFHLHLCPHVQVAQPLQKRRGVGIKVGTQQRGIEGHAHDTCGFQVLQLRQTRIVGHDGNAFVAPGALRQRVEQTPVVQPITRIGANQQGVQHMVCVQHLSEQGRRSGFGWCGHIPGVAGIGKAQRVQHMDVAVNDGFGGVHGEMG
jgi:hypothetical protein